MLKLHNFFFTKKIIHLYLDNEKYKQFTQELLPQKKNQSMVSV